MGKLLMLWLMIFFVECVYQNPRCCSKYIMLPGFVIDIRRLFLMLFNNRSLYFIIKLQSRFLNKRVY